jgi:hypothetical protein
MTEVETPVEQFVTLFRGGRIAIDNPDDGKGFRPWVNSAGEGYEASGEVFYKAMLQHFADHKKPIGVYPLEKVDDRYVVHWGCVDWDDGDEESLIHATNVQTLLWQLDVPSWVERSRSKGYHLWVFFIDAMPAVDVRNGLLAVCKIVDAPTKEVNPKQTMLGGKGWGNGVRLPYPSKVDSSGTIQSRVGRNVVLDPETGDDMTVEDFAHVAYSTRLSLEDWDPVLALYVKPKPKVIPQIAYRGLSTSNMRGLAGAIRRNGPRRTAEKPHGDRSQALVALAHAMREQGYPGVDILTELESADAEWGGKFAKRHDGKERLWEIVERTLKSNG